MTIDVHLRPEDLAAALRDDVRAGLTADPKTLPPKYFYDERGSELFEAITRLPEYYPTEAERSILRARATDIVRTAGADTLVELGSGVSDKTLVLLDAMAEAGVLRRYVPFDVAESTLRSAADRLARRYRGLDIHGVVGDFGRHLGEIPTGGRRLVAFLGGTIGNLTPGERHDFLADVASVLGDGDSFLLGTDLVKDPSRLVAAYDDGAGVTAEFNRNVLAVLNRELDGDFDPDRFEHRAVWVPDEEWIEMRLRARGDQRVRLGDLDLDVVLADGEEIRTEISAKFHPGGVEAELAAAGLHQVAWWTDPAGDFAVSLSRPAT